MSNTQDRKQALIEHKVITDVLPGNLDLLYDLHVEWPDTKLNNTGEELGREATQPEPILSLIQAVSKDNPCYSCTELTRQPPKPLDNLVLIMVDPVRPHSSSQYKSHRTHS